MMIIKLIIFISDHLEESGETFKAASIAWNALPKKQKAPYNKRAKEKKKETVGDTAKSIADTKENCLATINESVSSSSLYSMEMLFRLT